MIVSDVTLVEMLLNKFLSLHILKINRVINLLTVNYGYSEHCRSGAGRKSGGA